MIKTWYSAYEPTKSDHFVNQNLNYIYEFNPEIRPKILWISCSLGRNIFVLSLLTFLPPRMSFIVSAKAIILMSHLLLLLKNGSKYVSTHHSWDFRFLTLYKAQICHYFEYDSNLWRGQAFTCPHGLKDTHKLACFAVQL